MSFSIPFVRDVSAGSYLSSPRTLGLLSSFVCIVAACADAAAPAATIEGQAALAERNLALSAEGEAEKETGEEAGEPAERIPTDKELVLEQERLAYERAVAESPEIAERVAAASTELVVPDEAYAVTPTEVPSDDSFCTSDRLPQDRSDQVRREQRVIASTTRHRSDVDHLVRARARKDSDQVSPDSLRELIGSDGSWRLVP